MLKQVFGFLLLYIILLFMSRIGEKSPNFDFEPPVLSREGPGNCTLNSIIRE